MRRLFFTGRYRHGCRRNDSCCLTLKEDRVSHAHMQTSVYADKHAEQSLNGILKIA